MASSANLEGGSAFQPLYLRAAAGGIWALRGGFLLQLSRCDPNVRNVQKGNNGITLFLTRMRSWRGQSQMEVTIFAKHRFTLPGNGSSLLLQAFDQISYTVRELDYFSLSLDVEIDCGITSGGAINGLF